MFEILKKELVAKIIFVIFILFSLWWLYLQISEPGLNNQIFGAAYGVIALLGGVYGIKIANKWGGLNSLMGKGILMFSLGLLAQEFGQIIYSIYTFFLHVDIPYPSLGDLGYFGSIPLYILGIYYIAKMSGVKFGLKSLTSKFQSLLIPLVMLIIAYILFLRNYQFSETDILTVFLDLGYPFGEAIYISLAIMTYLMSRKILGGIMRDKILFILFALVVQFVADYSFLYLSRYSEIGPGGVVDFIYLFAYLLMATSLVQFKTVHDELTNK